MEKKNIINLSSNENNGWIYNKLILFEKNNEYLDEKNNLSSYKIKSLVYIELIIANNEKE